MKVQLDRFEDNGWAVLMVYEERARSFDVPVAMLPPNSAPGDVFDVNLRRDPEETEHMAQENRRLMDELLGRDE